MKTTTELITPQMARTYLDTSKGNRRIRRSWVLVLIAAMRRGQFYHTHQGISFNCDGTLRDGHHRLIALAECGIPQTMQVTRGATDQAHLVTDWMRPRTVGDAMVIDGDEWINRTIIAIGRMWLTLINNHRCSPDGLVLRDFVRDKKVPLMWADDIAANSIYGHSAFLTLLAIGMENGFQEDLSEWYTVIKSGVAKEDWQTSAVCLRDWWLRNKTSAGAAIRVHLCHRVYSSMRAWIERRPLTRSYAASKIDWIEDSPCFGQSRGGKT